MNSDAPKTLKESFSVLKDQRDESKCRHKLIDIVILAIAAVICGADDLTGIEAIGKAKVEWFKRLKAGLPIELGGSVVQGIDNQGVDRHHLAGLSDALQGIGEQDGTDPLALVGFGNCQSSQ